MQKYIKLTRFLYICREIIRLILEKQLPMFKFSRLYYFIFISRSKFETIDHDVGNQSKLWTALPQKFPFILDRNLANCTGNRVCTSCDIVVLGSDFNNRICNNIYIIYYYIYNICGPIEAMAH